MILLELFIYIFSFILIWFGAGLIVSSVDRFSHKLRLSSFIVSFVVLGLLTSTPELAVGLTAVSEHQPEIFAGNLLGGIPVIFLFVIPILAILGKGIAVKHDLDGRTLAATLVTILAPSVLLLDKKLSMIEGVILLLLYVILLIIIQSKHGFFDMKKNILEIKAYSYKDMLKLIIGIGIIFAASQQIVAKTEYFSALLKLSPFYISLIGLSLGTNIPELSLAIRSVFFGKKDIAFGDYLGSAAANTFLFGLLTLLYGGEVVTSNNFTVTFIFVALSLMLFYLFSRSKNAISRREGFILLFTYLSFVVAEYIQ